MNTIQIMTHVVVGYRSIEETETLIEIMANAGVSFIELQFPFSDPIGDGPTISQANHIALENGMSIDKSFSFFERMASKVSVPLLIMTYANVAYRMGFSTFIQRSKEVGAKGIIMPDMHFGTTNQAENKLFFDAARKYELPIVPVFSPNMSLERISYLASHMAEIHTHFMVYSTLRVGVTGTHTKRNHAGNTHTARDCAQVAISSSQDIYLQHIRTHFPALLACGFGIDSAEKVQALQSRADVAVIGSHLIQLYKDTPIHSSEGMKRVEIFLKGITQG